MRPDSIRKFDIFYLAAIAIGLASSLLNYDVQMDAAAVELSTAGLQDQAGTVMLVTLGLILAFNMLLWFLASRMRIGFVRWILLVVVLISVATRLMGITQGANVSITDLISVLLKAISVFFLFRADTSEWFAARSE
ncbi:hypothetical protein [Aurantiacibacter marinus]|uniref:Uncharacterized protein n=1 Tax=Aurantiacibacter marinus TaxID=874156 RepID=A0A0H0XRV9_9SPHN|nr:hypothetical protein [Aurantiacibacter marinus]KLI64692.1 hypothetical protein AAV99_03910 [Aurantiacibacter marinus]